MIRQCAWCLKMLGEVAPLSDKSMTHGICKACERGILQKMGIIGIKSEKKS